MTDRDNSQSPFQRLRVGLVATGHAVHDIYTAFLAPLLPVLTEKFSLMKAEAGLLTVFMQLPSLLQPLFGHLADRGHIRRWVFLAPGLTATGMSLLLMLPSYHWLAVLLILIGTSSAMFHAVAPVIAGRFSGSQLGRGMGFWMVGGEFGRTAGPLLITGFLTVLPESTVPWLMMPGWISSLLLYRYFNESQDPAEARAKQKLHLFRAMLRMRHVMLPLGAVIALRAMLSASITTFLPLYLTDEGEALWFAGVALALLEAAGILGALYGGRISDRYGRRRVLAMSFLLSPLFMMLFIFTEGWVRLLVLPLMGGVLLSMGPVVMAMVQENFMENRALANGIYMALSFVIRSVAVFVVGIIGDIMELRQAYLISAVVMLLGTPLVALLPRSRQNRS